jgi:uncharacterized protein YfbU (UPF0304 family)
MMILDRDGKMIALSIIACGELVIIALLIKQMLTAQQKFTEVIITENAPRYVRKVEAQLPNGFEFQMSEVDADGDTPEGIN